MPNNTQFQRTDKAIQSAVLSLLRRKPFARITVQDILDETPVSRATFYKHYHDKYEIVEKMQEAFLDLHNEVTHSLSTVPPAQMAGTVQSLIQRHGDTMLLLLKVQTDRVNLPMALMKASEERYLATSTSPHAKLEAHVYAAARTAFQINLLESEQATANGPHVFLNAALGLLGLSEDQDAKNLLLQKLERQK